MTPEDVCDIVHQALRRFNDERINDVTFDSDGKSCEVILTVDDGGQKQDFVISSRNIIETERDYCE